MKHALALGSLVLLLTLSACASTPTAGVSQHATPEEVIVKVRQAARLLADQGDAALATFRDPDSRFSWKDTYVFVVDCEADRVLANPAFPDRVGGDIKIHTDYAGNPYGVRLCETASRPGGGWIEYVWLRPGDTEPLRKVSFVMSVPGRSYQVGAGVYDDELSLAELEQLLDE